MPATGNSVISFDTPKTVLVPEELYTPGGEADLLAFGGMAPSDGEVAVASAARGGMVAVMAVPSAEWESAGEQLERGGVSVTSPLLDVACAVTEREGGLLRLRGGRRVELVVTGANLYLAVGEGGRLMVAEALPDNSPDSVLYCMQLLGRRFELRRFRIRVSGENAADVANALGKYYKRVDVV